MEYVAMCLLVGMDATTKEQNNGISATAPLEVAFRTRNEAEANLCTRRFPLSPQTTL